MIDPLQLLVRAGLAGGDRAVERPGGATVGRSEGPDDQLASRVVDPDRGRPGGAVRGPIDRRVGVERITGRQWQGGLPPGGAAGRGEELRLPPAAVEVVRRGDNLLRIPEVDPDVGFAARPRRAGDQHVRADRSAQRRLGHIGLARAGGEIGMARHPVGDLFQDERIAAGRIRRRVLTLRMRLAPSGAQPERDRQPVRALVRPQRGEILVRLDHPLERAPLRDTRELRFQGRSRDLRSPNHGRRDGKGGKGQSGNEGRSAHVGSPPRAGKLSDGGGERERHLALSPTSPIGCALPGTAGVSPAQPSKENIGARSRAAPPETSRCGQGATAVAPPPERAGSVPPAPISARVALA